VDRCRWQSNFLQTFELDIQQPGNGGEFRYRLVIEHTEDGDKVRAKEEHLSYQGQPLFDFKMGEVQLYRDDHSAGPKYPFDWSLSGLAAISERKDNKLLTSFKNQMNKLVIAQILPPIMQEETGERGETILAKNLENFAGWYRTISHDQGLVNRLTQSLREVLEGFDSFKFDPYGTRYLLQTRFYFEGLKSSINYRFSELSDGQRMLITLYTLLEAARDGGYILCLDEPENFVSLPEIQPWLNTLRDLCDENQTQAILISHHPEMIDLLASQACWFERPNGLATRLPPLPESQEGDLKVSELIARRWLSHE
jgi:predicted ATPase